MPSPTTELIETLHPLKPKTAVDAPGSATMSSMEPVPVVTVVAACIASTMSSEFLVPKETETDALDRVDETMSYSSPPPT